MCTVFLYYEAVEFKDLIDDNRVMLVCVLDHLVAHEYHVSHEMAISLDPKLGVIIEVLHVFHTAHLKTHVGIFLILGTENTHYCAD
jgi:hypothetical protein